MLYNFFSRHLLLTFLHFWIYITYSPFTLILLIMKKSLLLLGLSALILAGCASNKVIQPRTTVQGTISYYNLEKDRWSGEETDYGKSHLAVYLNLDSGSMLGQQGEMSRISLWCTSWDRTTLYRDLLVVTGQNNSYDRQAVKAEPLQLPQDLDQKKIQVDISRPVNLYTLTTELTDQWRIGDCYALSDVRNIIVK